MHLAFLPKKGPGLDSVRENSEGIKQGESIRDRVYGDSHYLTGVVDVVRDAVISAQSAQVDYLPVLPDDCAKLLHARPWINDAVAGAADNLPLLVDRRGFAAFDARKNAEVDYLALRHSNAWEDVGDQPVGASADRLVWGSGSAGRRGTHNKPTFADLMGAAEREGSVHVTVGTSERLQVDQLVAVVAMVIVFGFLDLMVLCGELDGDRQRFFLITPML